MKIFIGTGFIACLLISTLLFSPPAKARDAKSMYSIAEALQSRGSEQLDSSKVQFFFGDQSHPPIAENYGKFTSNKKTNAVGKKDKTACQWVFLSAMISFQKRALHEGGDAVVNIHSYYKKNDISSETKFMCGAGAIIAGVTFRGDVVKLSK